MAGITIYEFDAVAADHPGSVDEGGLKYVPPRVYNWLEEQALIGAESATWIKLIQRRGKKAVQVNNFVGVIRAQDGYQIEVLPKVAKAIGKGDDNARMLLIEMLRCLSGFRHIQTQNASLMAARMPLLEVFIAEFLRAVEHVVKRGLRGDYCLREDNLFALRGKLQIAEHLRKNLLHRDRFFVAFDEFSSNRPENRLLHSALLRALNWSTSQSNQQLARELQFVFAEVPASTNATKDFQQIRLDRGMAHYEAALEWSRLILADKSPLTGVGDHCAPSLLFPMEAVFEAFVAKHLARQLDRGLTLRKQVNSLALVRHLDKNWFRLKPDLLVQSAHENCLVLDTKWKLIDVDQANGTDKYGLSQHDFYQLYTYGQNFLNGQGDLVLIYPKTDIFNRALPVFEFPKSKGLRLWVLPFCLQSRQLLLPPCGSLDKFLLPSP